MHAVELRIEMAKMTKSVEAHMAFLPRIGETVAIWANEKEDYDKYVVTQVVHFVDDTTTVYLTERY